MKITSSRLRLGATASAAALAAVGILAATGNAVGAGGPAPDRDVRVLQFGVKFSPQNVIDVPPLQQHPGDYRPGDYATFGDVLINSNGRRVGVEAGAGLITRVGDAGAQIFFNMAIKLPAGSITVAGISSADPHKHLVVTGGTGSFLGAKGGVYLIEHRDQTGSLRVTLR